MSDPKDSGDYRDDTTPPEMLDPFYRAELLRSCRRQYVQAARQALTEAVRRKWIARAQQCDAELDRLAGAGQ